MRAPTFSSATLLRSVMREDTAAARATAQAQATAQARTTAPEHALVLAARRLLDSAAAALLGLFVTTPAALVFAAARLPFGRPVFRGVFIHGADGPRRVLVFNASSERAASLALPLALATGAVTLVGPALRRVDRHPAPVAAAGCTPGLASLWFVRRAAAIAHGGPETVDREYLAARSLSSDALLLAKSILFLPIAPSAPAAPVPVDLFGVRLENGTMAEAVDWITERLERGQETRLAFLNPDCFNRLVADDAYRAALGRMDRLHADGVGTRLAAALTGQRLVENVNGTDLFPILCEHLAATGRRLFLYGGRPGVADALAERLQARYPGLGIAGAAHGYQDAEGRAAVMASIEAARPDVLCVAFGAPLQEKWMATAGVGCGATVTIGVGGLFDFHSGRIRRAPAWMREAGLEWVYRMIQEPGRLWRRYVIGNPLFLARVVAARLRGAHAAGPREVAGTPDRVEAARRLELRYAGTGARRRAAIRRAVWKTTVSAAYGLKRGLDIAGSLAGLLVLSPLFAITSLAIWIENPGPVFFTQARVGRHGRHFAFYKFRSMVMNAEALKDRLLAQNESSGGVIFKMKADPRVTRVGRFIRRFSIDELPQLLNVLKGDMSLVGPRPPVPREVAEYTLADRKRLDVIPGITCIWQVSGRSEIPFPQQVRLDLEYIRTSGLVADLRLLVRTVSAVLSGRGAY